jgi:hypothetical protein
MVHRKQGGLGPAQSSNGASSFTNDLQNLNGQWTGA